MKKLLILFLGFVLSHTVVAQTPNVPQSLAPSKLNLIHFSKHSNSANLYLGMEPLLSETDTTVIVFNGRSLATMYFLNTWFQVSAGQDSILLAYLEYLEKTSFNSNIYLNENLLFDNLGHLKIWKNSLPESKRKLIKFESFFTGVEFESDIEVMSNIYFLHHLTKNFKGLELDVQVNIDAIEAVFDVQKILSASGSYERTPSFRENATLFEFFRNINKIDSSINGLIGPADRLHWNQYVKFVNSIKPQFINQFLYTENSNNNFYQTNVLLTTLELMIKQNRVNHFILVSEHDFYSVNKKDNPIIPLRTVINDLYPTVPVNRYLYYSGIDSSVKDSALNQVLFDDFGIQDTLNIQKIMIASDTAVGEEAYLVDTTVSVDENSFISKPFSFRSFGFEANYSRWFNDIKSFKDVADPANQIAHISTIGGSFVIQDGPTLSGYRSYRSSDVRFRFNYNQLFAKESVNWLWANQFGISIENKLFETNFLSIYLGNNLSYYNFTLSKTLSSPFDQFITNPSEMYQVTNDGFLYGIGINTKVALSAIYLKAEAGYQFDLSDSRWEYYGDKINSVGKMNITGGYFELGLGLNFGY
jgi:hypothetical protein